MKQVSYFDLSTQKLVEGTTEFRGMHDARILTKYPLTLAVTADDADAELVVVVFAERVVREWAHAKRFDDAAERNRIQLGGEWQALCCLQLIEEDGAIFVEADLPPFCEFYNGEMRRDVSFGGSIILPLFLGINYCSDVRKKFSFFF